MSYVRPHLRKDRKTGTVTPVRGHTRAGDEPVHTASAALDGEAVAQAEQDPFANVEVLAPASGHAYRWDGHQLLHATRAEWEMAGSTMQVAAAWDRTGCGPDEASEWSDAGVTNPDDAARWQQFTTSTEVRGWLDAVGSLEAAERWQSAGFVFSDDTARTSRHLTIEDVENLVSEGIPADEVARWAPVAPADHIKMWSDAGIDPDDADSWRKAGFGPDDAITWHCHGFAAEAAARWRRHDNSPASAARQRDRGLRP